MSLTLFLPQSKFASPLSYFIIAPKLTKSFALIYPDFELNLIIHVSETLGSAGQPEVTSFLPLPKAPKEFYAVLSAMRAYQ